MSKAGKRHSHSGGSGRGQKRTSFMASMAEGSAPQRPRTSLNPSESSSRTNNEGTRPLRSLNIESLSAPVLGASVATFLEEKDAMRLNRVSRFFHSDVRAESKCEVLFAEQLADPENIRCLVHSVTVASAEGLDALVQWQAIGGYELDILNIYIDTYSFEPDFDFSALGSVRACTVVLQGDFGESEFKNFRFPTGMRSLLILISHQGILIPLDRFEFPQTLETLSICPLYEYDEQTEETDFDNISMPLPSSFPRNLKNLHLTSLDPIYLADVVGYLTQLESLRIRYLGTAQLMLDLSNHAGLEHLRLSLEKAAAFVIRAPKSSTSLTSMTVNGAGMDSGADDIVLNECFVGLFTGLKRFLIDGFMEVEGLVQEMAPNLEEMYVETYYAKNLDTGSLNFAKGRGVLLKMGRQEAPRPSVRNSLESILYLSPEKCLASHLKTLWKLRASNAWHTTAELRLRRAIQTLRLDETEMRAEEHFRDCFPPLSISPKLDCLHLYAFKK